jgi:hypothetical protein
MDVVKQAAESIFRVFLAEHWARFYFAVEQDGAVVLDVPEEPLAVVEAEDAGLAAFLRELNGRPIDAESSKQAIGEHVFRSLEGGNLPQGTVAKAFDSPDFGLTMRLFSVWLSGHEALLDTETLPLAEWSRLFALWRQDPAVIRFAESLVAAGNPESPDGDTVN